MISLVPSTHQAIGKTRSNGVAFDWTGKQPTKRNIAEKTPMMTGSLPTTVLSLPTACPLSPATCALSLPGLNIFEELGSTLLVARVPAIEPGASTSLDRRHVIWTAVGLIVGDRFSDFPTIIHLVGESTRLVEPGTFLGSWLPHWPHWLSVPTPGSRLMPVAPTTSPASPLAW